MACEPDQDSTMEVVLVVNGRDIELNSFVQSFIARTVIGMVSSLRGVGDVETIDLKIFKKVKSSQVQ